MGAGRGAQTIAAYPPFEPATYNPCTMPIRYAGLFCPVGHFNVQEIYEVEHADSPVGLHWTVDGQREFQCKQCGNAFSYQQSDVAHDSDAERSRPALLD